MTQPDHQHPLLQNDQRGLYFSAAITLTYAAIEASVGWWANSLALLSDAGHMLTDTSTLLIAALGAWLTQRQPTPRHSYGLGRAEFIAALINGLLMLVVVSVIVINIVERVQQPLPVKGEVVSTVAFIGLVLNVLVLYLLGGHGETDLNQRAAVLHVLSDLLASIIAMLSGLVIVFTDWTLIDPLLSLLIVAFILYSTLRLLREVLHGLMEGVPLGLSLTAIGTEMAARPGVLSVHDLHVWSLSSQRLALSAHVVLQDLNQWDSILNDLRHMLLEHYGIDHVTLQPETPTRAVRSEGC
ncbi:cation diffusion facilitator family transporter [Nitrosomonas sp. Is37]|uniref:cation diffusion facilitator family transporter n=1 Tax=Nitrosomonas sp. Is37 TaxID=3080535 RepID=UPI00294B576D|nr:cation diffusion facilitator family transporter [Nitrosomonas sp. Is37]MDV6343079.1 cation diffusion facilitator family transporter [Nitrosomonas sp. Is37]